MQIQIGIPRQFLTPLRIIDNHPLRENRLWLCRCFCGIETTASEFALMYGRKKSCGCKRRVLRGRDNPSYKHGLTEPSGKKQPTEVVIYHGMISRCYNVLDKAYKNYGGRGIKVAEEWRGDNGLRRFLDYVGPRPEGRSLDRYPDNNGDYRPGNVRWATPKQQCRNTRRTRFITHAGVTLSLRDWDERLGFRLGLVAHRLEKGWSEEDAVTRPFNSPRRKRAA